jgi:hypothetical protein
MPDALNEVFRVNEMMEDIGGLVDPEDLPEGSSGAGRDGSSGAGGNDQSDMNDVDPTHAKKTYITSRPGTDGGSIGVTGSSSGGSVTRRTKLLGPVSLAEKLLSSLSPDAEARQNDNKAMIRLYLQQIRTLEDTIRMRELQIDALRQELTHSNNTLWQELAHSQDKLHEAERRADNLEMCMEVMGMMRTHCHEP